jgi:hypothetical protein
MSALNVALSVPSAPPLSVSISERLFTAITSFPEWLESFDALQIPAWAVLLSVAVGIAGFIFALREFLSWFLKTSSIVDEVVRLETLVRDLQGDLAALESTVSRLQSTASPAVELAAPTVHAPLASAPAKEVRQFRLDN